MAGSKPDSPDRLIVSSLRAPLLNEVMGSGTMRDDLWAIGQEIKARYIAKVPKDKGRLAATARLKAFRSKAHPDRRWMVDFTVGGIMGVDYADDVEREYGTLASVLREMGYNTGDYVQGPTGKTAKEVPQPQVRTAKGEDEKAAIAKADPMSASLVGGYAELSEAVDKVIRPGRRVGSKSYDADIENLRKLTQQIEDKYGPLDATVGKSAIAAYEAQRQAKADGTNYRVVYYVQQKGKAVRRTKDFTYSEDADEWAMKNLVQPMKGIPNARQYQNKANTEGRSRSARDSSGNIYGVIMNIGNHDGVYRRNE